MTKLEEWLSKTKQLIARDKIDNLLPMSDLLLWNRCGIIRTTESDASARSYGHEIMKSNEAMKKLLLNSFDVIEHLKKALEKCENQQLIGHKEPDDYTRLGCISHVAGKALLMDPSIPKVDWTEKQDE